MSGFLICPFLLTDPPPNSVHIFFLAHYPLNLRKKYYGMMDWPTPFIALYSNIFFTPYSLYQDSLFSLFSNSAYFSFSPSSSIYPSPVTLAISFQNKHELWSYDPPILPIEASCCFTSRVNFVHLFSTHKCFPSSQYTGLIINCIKFVQ